MTEDWTSPAIQTTITTEQPFSSAQRWFSLVTLRDGTQTLAFQVEQPSELAAMQWNAAFVQHATVIVAPDGEEKER